MHMHQYQHHEVIETNIFGNLVLLTVVPGHVWLVVGCAWHWPCIGMVAGPGWGFVLLVGGLWGAWVGPGDLGGLVGFCG